MESTVKQRQRYVVRGTENDNVTFKTWIINLFEDERGETSIKPVIAFVGSVFLCGAMLANSFYPNFIPADFLVDAVMIITAIGMGADSVDKFSSRGSGYRGGYGGGGYGGGYGESYYETEYEGYQFNSSDSAKESATDSNIGDSSSELL